MTPQEKKLAAKRLLDGISFAIVNDTGCENWSPSEDNLRPFEMRETLVTNECGVVTLSLPTDLPKLASGLATVKVIHKDNLRIIFPKCWKKESEVGCGYVSSKFIYIGMPSHVNLWHRIKKCWTLHALR